MTNYVNQCACSCKFKRFLIFLLLEYRYVASLQVLLGTRRRREKLKIILNLLRRTKCFHTLRL